MRQCAYSQLSIKRVDPVQRIVEGIASTPTPDRGGDVMVPEGAQYTLPIPFLWQHQDPIGEVFEAQVRADGIHIKAKISTVHSPGRLKAFVDDAWASIAATPPLVRGLSIGWKPIESVPMPGTKFTKHAKWIWGELSAVIVPMNSEATITNIKSCDTAATGARPRVILPGVTGLLQKDTAMHVSQQIETAQTELETKSTRFQELLTKDETEGGLEADERTERDTLQVGVDSLTAKIRSLKSLEAAQALRGTAIVPTPPTARTPSVRVEQPDLPKGTLFTRYAMAVAAGKGSLSDTIAYAKRWEAQTPEVIRFIKASAGSSVTESPGWGAELVYATNLASEFAELLRPMTIIGRIPGLRMTPFNVRVPVQTGGSTVAWVGEKAAKPVTELDFTTVTLGYDKIAGIIVLTEELVRLSSPSAEATVRRDLTEQIAQFMDQQFITPSVTATANNPASVTNNVTAIPATGTDLADLFTDFNSALAKYDTANMPTNDVVIVTTPTIARGMGALRNSLGIVDGQVSMNPTGGTVMGYPVIVSSSVPAGDIVFIKPSEVLVADDGRVTLDSSNQATLDMAGGNSPTFNLWQKNCIGIRAERWVTWQKRRTEAVQLITGAAYHPA
jgi:HK97 family phage major capsid protein